MKELFFCVFADYHYWPGHYPIGTDGLQTILRDAHQSGAQFIAHLGDLAHAAPSAPELVRLYTENLYGLPAFGCIGNHEMEAADSLKDVLACYGMECNYVYRDFEGFRLIFLDTNYYPDENGHLLHNPPHSHCPPREPGNDISNAEWNWLQTAVLNASCPCLLFSHASLEYDGGCARAKQVRSFISEVNAKQPGRVLMCLNGHNHRNSITNIDGVVYMDVNATYNGHWQIQKHNGFPPEFAASARMTANVCLFNDPLHAFVRVRENGEISVQGMETSYLFGVSPEMLGVQTVNPVGRVCEPRISYYHQNAVWR